VRERWKTGRRRDNPWKASSGARGGPEPVIVRSDARAGWTDACLLGSTAGDIASGAGASGAGRANGGDDGHDEAEGTDGGNHRGVSCSARGRGARGSVRP